MAPVAFPATATTFTTAAATAASTTSIVTTTTTATTPLPNAPSSPLLVLHVGSLAGHADQAPLRQHAGRKPAPVDAARVEPHRLVKHLQPPRRVVPEEHRLGAQPLPDASRHRLRGGGGAQRGRRGGG